MTRWAIAVAPGVGIVHGSMMGARELATLLADRAANGEAFSGERLVRLPRRVARANAFVAQFELFGDKRPEPVYVRGRGFDAFGKVRS